MRERPILFSAPMIRAILSGRKTMTRRIVKPQPIDVSGHSWAWPAFDEQKIKAQWSHGIKRPDSMLRFCPYGVPGDRLWVRETYAELDGRYSLVPLAYRADGEYEGPGFFKWKPSIFMPRWASRLTLEVTSVHVERLQDITEADAAAEGVIELDGELDEVALCARAKAMGETPTDCRVWFAELWDRINAKRAPWDSNPWVWTVGFAKVAS